MMQSFLKHVQALYKQMMLFIVALLILFTLIGVITTSNPSSRLSSAIFSSWMENIDQSIFSILYSMENRAFDITYQISTNNNPLPSALLEIATSIRMNDLKSLLGKEIPGFSTYENKVIVAGEEINDIDNYAHESGPPLETILEKREAVDNVENKPEKPSEQPPHSTGDRQVVFLYNSHNRESFLPHLPEEKKANRAYHEEVNITKISDRVAENLKKNGIGADVDETDIMQILHDKNWKYSKSYDASRPVVEEALAQNKDIQYILDIHRDSLPRTKTTKEIDGKNYASIMFVIGAENKNYEKNLELATNLHYSIDEKYPGVSKGVITKEGANSNGVYNQDLLDNALLMEIGGYENTLEEMYRSADIIAESFSELYWEAEKVNN